MSTKPLTKKEYIAKRESFLLKSSVRSSVTGAEQEASAKLHNIYLAKKKKLTEKYLPKVYKQYVGGLVDKINNITSTNASDNPRMILLLTTYNSKLGCDLPVFINNYYHYRDPQCAKKFNNLANKYNEEFDGYDVLYQSFELTPESFKKYVPQMLSKLYPYLDFKLEYWYRQSDGPDISEEEFSKLSTSDVQNLNISLVAKNYYLKIWLKDNK